jgi:parallel beta-helix repeat protein
MKISRLFLAGVALATWMMVPRVAHAAESYDNCVGFVDAVPAVITTQGTWCLRANLASSASGGAAVTIATNNVTLACNDFAIDGSGAGAASKAIGILAQDRTGLVVRGCRIRGFNFGVLLGGGSGNVVERNLVAGNLDTGIFVSGKGSRVLGNAVYDTGHGPESEATGISAAGDIVDNTVVGVEAPAGALSYVTGIESLGDDPAEVRNNIVRGLSIPGGEGTAVGFEAGIAAIVAENQVASGLLYPASGIAIYGGGFCRDNLAAYFSTGFVGCASLRDNQYPFP